LHKGCSFVCYWGNPLSNMPLVVINPLANLLQGVRGFWNPLAICHKGCRRLLATLLTNSSEGIGNFCK
jgi:hypothetical protein